MRTSVRTASRDRRRRSVEGRLRHEVNEFDEINLPRVVRPRTWPLGSLRIGFDGEVEV